MKDAVRELACTLFAEHCGVSIVDFTKNIFSDDYGLGAIDVLVVVNELGNALGVESFEVFETLQASEFSVENLSVVLSMLPGCEFTRTQ